MSRKYEIHIKQDPEIVVEKAKTAAQRSGATFEGDGRSGVFSGSGVEGTYVVEGQVLQLTITEKPAGIPWSLVESMVHSFFDQPEEKAKSSKQAGGEARDSAQDRKKADAIIKEHLLWSVGAGLVPIPFFDIAAVSAIQIGMLKQLSKLYGVNHDQESGKIFVSALTGTSLAKIGASVVKALPGVGTLIGGLSMSAFSGASTYALGQVAVATLVAKGNLGDVDLTEAKKAYASAFEAGKDFVSKVEKKAEEDEKSPAERLKQLKELRADDLITEEEYETKKDAILGEL